MLCIVKKPYLNIPKPSYNPRFFLDCVFNPLIVMQIKEGTLAN